MTPKLLRPLVLLDLETTGLWVEKDKIIEIGCQRYEVDGRKITFQKRINPEISIPSIVTQLTGIRDEDVKNAPIFKTIAQEVNDFIRDADIGGFNIENFDLPLLERELFEAGITFVWRNRKIFDAQKIFHFYEKRDLNAAYKYYCHKDLENAHRAIDDANAAFEILVAQAQKYCSGSANLDDLCKINYDKSTPFFDEERRLRWWNGELYPTFGKYRRRYSIKEIAQKDPEYLRWMLTTDFSEEVKAVIRKALEV